MSAGSRFRSIRQDIGLTQQEVADQCGINQGYISQYENDIDVPLEKLIRMHHWVSLLQTALVARIKELQL